MDLKTMFPNLNVMWTRWSDYEVVQSHKRYYLVPVPGATSLTYNCAEQPESLVADALELGRRLRLGDPDKERLCAAFAARHGLLGGDAECGPMIPVDSDVPPCFRPLNGPEYGEDIEDFQTRLMQLHQHFQTTRGELGVIANPKVLDLSGFLNYRLTSGRMPQLVWDVRSMESVLRFAYASMITSPGTPLKVCKNCGKVYYNTHAKSEFCGARCRNYYNVKVFRSREKENSSHDM